MKKSILGFNSTRLMKMAAFGFLSLNSILSFGQCNAVNPLEVPVELMNAGFDGSANFNAIVFGNYNTGDGGSTAGRLLVGGTFTLNSSGGGYQVGVADGSPVDKDNLVVESILSNNSGGQIKVRGDARYGSLAALSAAPIHDAGQGSNSVANGLFDYADLKTYYQNLSITKSNLSDVGAVNVTNGVVTLTGNGSIANYVFNVTLVGGQLSDVKFVNIPVGSEILINITNAFVEIAPAIGSVAMVSTYRNKTLFNFPNAESVLLSNFVLEGGLLAPMATLSAQTAQVKGSSVIGGNILLATNFSFQTGCLTNPLPVTLSSFTVRREGSVSNLTWSTASETNAQKFVIERSVTAKQWDKIGETLALGESKEIKDYSFADHNPLSGANFYRLKMVDTDATFSYSRIVTVNFPENDRVNIFPNPATAELSITSAAAINIIGLEILDQSGKPLMVKPYDGKSIDIKNWSSGLYFVRITMANGNTSTHKINKN